MYAYFKGSVNSITDFGIILEVNGIGYNIHMPSNFNLTLGDEFKIYTYTYVKEDVLSLFGFMDEDTLSLFKLLITVSGIGPKGALGMLSCMDSAQLRLSIVSGDFKALSKAPGIGKKTAERVILELREKIGDISLSAVTETTGQIASAAYSGAAAECMDALTALGYSRSEAQSALSKVGIHDDMSTEDILKLTLRHL